MYPTGQQARAVMKGEVGAPSGAAEHAIYANEIARYQEKKNKKNGDDPATVTLPKDPQAYIDMEPEARFAALCKLTSAQLNELRRQLPPADKDRLVAGFTPKEVETIAAFNSPQGVIAAEAVQTRLLRAIYSERQLKEMMVDFWLNHFNVYMRKSQQSPYYIASYERDAIRPYALGHFEQLLQATATSPAMLNYLDNSSSVGPHSRFAAEAKERKGKQTPEGLNENYARELMELHTVGVNGGYTQHDVTEVAKVFTGWTVVRPQVLGTGPHYNTNRYGQTRRIEVPDRFNAIDQTKAEFDPNKHEPGKKTVLGVTIKEDGEHEGFEVLHILATSPQTAHFISTKLAIRFVSDDPPPAMVDRMAATFMKTNGDIRQVLLAMLQSPEFFDRSTYRAKVKTPLDYVVSAVRASGAEVVSTGGLAAVLSDLGMPLYGMLTPNGYSMRADPWNNTQSLVARMNFALALSTNRIPGVTTDWTKLMHRGEGSPGASDEASLSPEVKDKILEAYLLHEPVSDRTRQAILAQMNADPDQQKRNMNQLASTPVRGRDQLTGLLIASAPKTETDAPDPQAALAAGLLFGSPEFQRR